MKNFLIPGAVALIFSLFSCNDLDTPLPAITKKQFDVIGQAQKGPFINGSDVNVYELDYLFKPTGRTFHVKTDQKGHFELTGIELVSPYVELLADGFFYNEVRGELSDERMNLRAIIDLTEHTNININVLTNLEFERVKYLIDSKGSSLHEAKIRAQKELLKVFSVDNIQIDEAESLDIVNSGDADAVLLAVSCILQGNRTTAELSKLQADIILDMKEDGILGDTLLQSSLISQSLTLNLEKIQKNLIEKYSELGVAISNTNDFEKYITNFNLHSTYHYHSPIEYPSSTLNGINLLALNTHKFEAYTFYSFAVKMPDEGKIKIKVKLTDGPGSWWYLETGNYGWKVDPYDNSTHQQTFTSTINGGIIDLPLAFTVYGTAIVEYYNIPSTLPSITKTIGWGAFNDNAFEFNDDSPMGLNLLALNDGSEITSNTSYIIQVFGNIAYRLKFKLQFPDSVTPEVIGGYGFYTFNFIPGCLEFELASSEFGDTTFIRGVSEIKLKFKGKGQISIESDMLFDNGKFLKKKLHPQYLKNLQVVIPCKGRT